MLYFIPWVVLIVAVIVAVPVAAKLSPGPARPGGATRGDDADDYSEVADEGANVEDDFGADGSVEALGDDAFAEFN